MFDAAPDDSHAASPAPSTELEKRLREVRTVLVFGEITMALAARVSAELVCLAHESTAPIRMLINSPGGHVEAGDTIHDMVRFIGVDVTMIGTGWVASAGALIYASVPRARRVALPNTRFLLHQPTGGAGGPASDIEIEALQIMAVRSRLNRLFADATGQTIERVAHDTDRNHWLSAQEALDYGLVGQIVASSSDLARL